MIGIRRNKLAALVVLMVFCLTIFASWGGAKAQAATIPQDIWGHWAQSYIEKLIGQEAVSGYPDGTFRPNQMVTRLEFMLMMNNAFNVSDTREVVHFYDVVNERDWFSHEIAKAVMAGYIGGYPDHTFRPNALVSRQEAASMVARMTELDTAVPYPLTFADKTSIPIWSRPAIAAMAAVGYLSGYPDGTFRPFDGISRAEAAVIIIRAQESKTKIYNQRGTYGPSSGLLVIDSDVIVTVPGIVLRNMQINGNLSILGSVGTDFSMRNVTVKGVTRDYR